LADFGAVPTHDTILRLGVDANVQLPTKVARDLKESACRGFGSMRQSADQFVNDSVGAFGSLLWNISAVLDRWLFGRF
jgi:hypothetical protein